MDINEILEIVREYSVKLLPVFALIALLVLIIVMIRLSSLMKRLKITVTGVNKAVDTTNTYLGEMDVTVKAVNNLAMSVEAVRFTTEKAVKKSAAEWNKTYHKVKDWVTEALEEADAKKKAKAVAEKQSEAAVETIKK